MGPMWTKAIFIFVIGYLDAVSADHKDDPTDCSVCGYNYPRRTPKLLSRKGHQITDSRQFLNRLIRKGHEVTDTRQFPWMVDLEYKGSFCAGALLDEYFILTAGHCVSSGNGEIDYQKKAYFQTRSPREMSKGATIDKIMVHPKFEMRGISTGAEVAVYDIALLKLKEKIKCNMYRRPICLPSPDWKIPFGKANIIAGWGTASEEGIAGKTDVLNYATLKHLNFQTCIEALPDVKMLRDHMLCVGGTNQTGCKGDSGGPLMDKINGKYTVVGVSSAQLDPKCSTSKPMIYTSVAKTVKWIKEQQKAALEEKIPMSLRYPLRRYRKRKCNRNKNRRFHWNIQRRQQNQRERYLMRLKYE